MTALAADDGVRTRPRSAWSRVWPAGLGLLVAAATVLGLADGREVAPVVVASGLVYLAAAVVGRRWAAWPAFGVTFVVMTAAKLADLDASVVLLACAGLLLVVGLALQRWLPVWGYPVQAAAMLVLAALALVAIQIAPTAGGLVVAAALLAHAAWDVHHHRTGRVVSRSLAEFCCGLFDGLGPEHVELEPVSAAQGAEALHVRYRVRHAA